MKAIKIHELEKIIKEEISSTLQHNLLEQEEDPEELNVVDRLVANSGEIYDETLEYLAGIPPEEIEKWRELEESDNVGLLVRKGKELGYWAAETAHDIISMDFDAGQWKPYSGNIINVATHLWPEYAKLFHHPRFLQGGGFGAGDSILKAVRGLHNAAHQAFTRWRGGAKIVASTSIRVYKTIKVVEEGDGGIKAIIQIIKYNPRKPPVALYRRFDAAGKLLPGYPQVIGGFVYNGHGMNSLRNPGSVPFDEALRHMDDVLESLGWDDLQKFIQKNSAAHVEPSFNKLEWPDKKAKELMDKVDTAKGKLTKTSVAVEEATAVVLKGLPGRRWTDINVASFFDDRTIEQKNWNEVFAEINKLLASDKLPEPALKNWGGMGHSEAHKEWLEQMGKKAAIRPVNEFGLIWGYRGGDINGVMLDDAGNLVEEVRRFSHDVTANPEYLKSILESDEYKNMDSSDPKYRIKEMLEHLAGESEEAVRRATDTDGLTAPAHRRGINQLVAAGTDPGVRDSAIEINKIIRELESIKNSIPTRSVHAGGAAKAWGAAGSAYRLMRAAVGGVSMGKVEAIDRLQLVFDAMEHNHQVRFKPGDYEAQFIKHLKAACNGPDCAKYIKEAREQFRQLEQIKDLRKFLDWKLRWLNWVKDFGVKVLGGGARMAGWFGKILGPFFALSDFKEAMAMKYGVGLSGLLAFVTFWDPTGLWGYVAGLESYKEDSLPCWIATSRAFVFYTGITPDPCCFKLDVSQEPDRTIYQRIKQAVRNDSLDIGGEGGRTQVDRIDPKTGKAIWKRGYSDINWPWEEDGFNWGDYEYRDKCKGTPGAPSTPGAGERETWLVDPFPEFEVAGLLHQSTDLDYFDPGMGLDMSMQEVLKFSENFLRIVNGIEDGLRRATMRGGDGFDIRVTDNLVPDMKDEGGEPILKARHALELIGEFPKLMAPNTTWEAKEKRRIELYKENGIDPGRMEKQIPKQGYDSDPTNFQRGTGPGRHRFLEQKNEPSPWNPARDSIIKWKKKKVAPPVEAGQEQDPKVLYSIINKVEGQLNSEFPEVFDLTKRPAECSDEIINAASWTRHEMRRKEGGEAFEADDKIMKNIFKARETCKSTDNSDACWEVAVREEPVEGKNRLYLKRKARIYFTEKTHCYLWAWLHSRYEELKGAWVAEVDREEGKIGNQDPVGALMRVVPTKHLVEMLRVDVLGHLIKASANAKKGTKHQIPNNLDFSVRMRSGDHHKLKIPTVLVYGELLIRANFEQYEVYQEDPMYMLFMTKSLDNMKTGDFKNMMTVGGVTFPGEKVPPPSSRDPVYQSKWEEMTHGVRWKDAAEAKKFFREPIDMGPAWDDTEQALINIQELVMEKFYKVLTSGEWHYFGDKMLKFNDNFSFSPRVPEKKKKPEVPVQDTPQKAYGAGDHGLNE
jgi:hypothetical protein